MKRLSSIAASLLLLGMVAGPALAGEYGRGHEGRQHAGPSWHRDGGYGRHDRHDYRADRDVYRHDRRVRYDYRADRDVYRHDQRVRYDYRVDRDAYRHDRRRVPPPVVYVHTPPRGGYGPRHAYWVRGGRYYGSGYAPTYVVNNWSYYGLRTPPRGYYWRRSDTGDFLLVALATGIIADIVLNH